MKKIVTLFVLLLIAVVTLTAQPPQAFKYKAVARDRHGRLLILRDVNIRINILQGGETGPAVFVETHTTASNLFGIIELEIGRGTLESGDFPSIDWGAADYFIKIELDPRCRGDYTVIGTAQLLSVPYALYAGSVSNSNDNDPDPQNEVITSAYLNGTFLEIMEGGSLTIIDLSGLQDGVEDADSDPVNEVQDILLSGTNLSITKGSTVDLSTLPDDVDDADADPENEIQDLQLTGNILTITKNGAASQIDLSIFFDDNDNQTLSIAGHELTIEDGNTITLPDNADDADSDPTNEIQDISLSGTSLSITGGSTIELSVIQDGYEPDTDDQTLSVIGHELTISEGNTITLPDDVEDADADPLNEIQDLSLSGNDLILSEDATSVDLSAYMDNTDNQTLKLNGKILQIVRGNTVILPDEVNDDDADPGNEIQDISIEGHLLTISGGSTVQIPDSVNDADADPINELITGLTLNGTDLEITDAGGTYTADLSSLSGGTGNQTLSDVLTLGNDADGNIITNLADPVNDQDAATKAYVDVLKSQIAALEYMLMYDGSFKVTDVDGNKYKAVNIGNQVWMAENLKTTRFNDGTDILLVTDNNNSVWSNLTTPGYCWYNDDSAIYANTYGALYNWYTVETGNLCPIGWHVPSDDDWKQLEMYLGMSQTEADDTEWRGTDEGGKLKEASILHWQASYPEVTDTFGFTALPGGYRINNGNFYHIGYYGFWWSSSEYEYSSIDSWFRGLYCYDILIQRSVINKKSGFSVRCIRD